VEVDQQADVAYIRLSDNPVARSHALDSDVVVDLDAMNVVVGVEMLHLNAEIPYTQLVTDFHVRSELTELMRQLRPSISGFLSLHSMAEGTVSSSRAHALA
jgi:uncharacterized protein YuzE